MRTYAIRFMFTDVIASLRCGSYRSSSLRLAQVILCLCVYMTSHAATASPSSFDNRVVYDMWLLAYIWRHVHVYTNIHKTLADNANNYIYCKCYVLLFIYIMRRYRVYLYDHTLKKLFYHCAGYITENISYLIF